MNFFKNIELNKKKYNKLALGTVQFGLDYGISNTHGMTSSNEVKTILELASSVGINFLDTASAYGKSEEVLGRMNLMSWHIISKFSSLSNSKNIECILEQSLIRLGQESIYGYLAHDARTLLDNPLIWNELEIAKSKGKIQKIGYSVYKPAELEKLLEKEYYPDLLQVPFNILDQRFSQYFDALKTEGTEIHIRSAFLQGLFFMDTKTLPDYFNEIKPVLQELELQFPDKTRRAAYLLNFCLVQSGIDKVVMGVDSSQQFKENMDILSGASNMIGLLSFPPISEEVLLPYNWPK